MGYLQARADLAFMQRFRSLVAELWRFEDAAVQQLDPHQARHLLPRQRQELIQTVASRVEGYQELHWRVAGDILRANRIARQLDAPIECLGYPPPGVDGPLITQSSFDAIINDNSYVGTGRHTILDALSQTTSASEAQLHAEKRHLVNPFYWLRTGFVFVIRIPFMMVEASGFDVSKVEDHLLGRAFKLLEIGLIVALLIWLGLSREEIGQALAAFLSGLGGSGP